MINMKMEESENESNTLVVEKQDYPYGLCLHLDTESLDRLGIKELPQVGQTIGLKAIVEVKSVSMSEHEDKVNRSVSLQITDMELGPPEVKKEPPIKKLYGKPDNAMKPPAGTKVTAGGYF